MPNTTEIEQKVKQVLLENLQNVSPKKLSQEAELFSLGLNSLNAVSIVLGLEEKFGFEFDMDEIEYHHFKTIATIVKLVENKIQNP